MIEKLEGEIQNYLKDIYIPKTKEIVSNVRKLHASGQPRQGMCVPPPPNSRPRSCFVQYSRRREFTAGLNTAVLKHGAKRVVDNEI